MKENYVNQITMMNRYRITKRLVKIFFAEPDYTNTNPFGAGLPPERMFAVERIEKVIETQKFKEEFEYSMKFSKRHKNRDRSTYPGRKGYPKKDSSEKSSKKSCD